MLLGWRETTIDVDIALDPDHDDLLRALPAIKEELQINVELASPRHFIRCRAAGKNAVRRSAATAD